MKRSTVIGRKQKKTRSPYAAKGKRPYLYPAWCGQRWLQDRLPIPREIQEALRRNRILVFPRVAEIAPRYEEAA